MIGNLVAGVGDRAHHVGRCRRPPADEEERRPRAVRGQDVEDARRPSRIRAIVEGEGDGAILDRAAPDRGAREEVGQPRVADEGAGDAEADPRCPARQAHRC